MKNRARFLHTREFIGWEWSPYGRRHTAEGGVGGSMWSEADGRPGASVAGALGRA